jgi:hypothetical protein
MNSQQTSADNLICTAHGNRLCWACGPAGTPGANSYRGLSFAMIRAHGITHIGGAPIPDNILRLVSSSGGSAK